MLLGISSIFELCDLADVFFPVKGLPRLILFRDSKGYKGAIETSVVNDSSEDKILVVLGDLPALDCIEEEDWLEFLISSCRTFPELTICVCAAIL